MKRIVSILLCFTIVFGIALSLSSCHGRKMMNDFVMPDGLEEGRVYEITFWAKNDSNATQIEIYEKAIENFEALYPNIKVNLKRYTNYGLIYQDVITNIGTGTTPNVCITYPDHIATYNTTDNIVVPLDELIADDKYGLGGSAIRFDAPELSEIVPQFVAEGQINGEQYALPYMRSTEACYINVDLIKALGYDGVPEVLTWDFVWEVSEAAMQPIEKDKDGRDIYVNGQNVIYPFIYKSTDNMMIQYLAQSGADYSTPEGDILLYNETSKELLSEVADHVRSGAFTTFSAIGYPGNFFNLGQCIFAIDSTAGATWMGPEAPLIEVPEDKLVNFEVAVTTVPQVNEENPKMISQGPSICVFNKEDPTEVLASWIFAQYMLTDEVQIAFAQTEGYIPVTKTAQSNPEYVDYLSRAGEDNELYYDVKIEASKVMLDNLESTFTTPVFVGSASVRNAAGELIESVVKAISRKQPTDSAALDKMYDKLVAQYRLDHLGANSNKPVELGKLPDGAVALIISFGGIWLALGAWVLIKYLLAHKSKQ